ncbi:methyltransferase-domain-containing protein [Hysterangium stoloniferum]|nr:methyltransferase-domain-containing protein [Hysterangium stoloniferum]
MSLFQVKDWDVPSQTVVTTSQTSRKRKRPAVQAEANNVHSAQINIDSLMHMVDKGGFKLDAKTRPKKTKKQGRKHNDSLLVAGTRTAGPKRIQPVEKAAPSLNRAEAVGSPKDTTPSNRAKNKDSHSAPPTNAVSSKKHKKLANPKSNVVGLTSLQSSMKDNLDGARFRHGYFYEVIFLYTTSSTEGHKMIQDDPKIFEEYHSGFRQQVLSWPHNPVDHYISVLASYPKGTVIADLGCGDAALARTLVPKGYTVLSYDLVRTGPYILEADVCQRIPLPGSEGSNEGQIVDVCICALSLMSLDWIKCIRESWRILKPRGELKIAEVASRLVNIDQFVDIVSHLGFMLKSKDVANTHFTLFEFQKVSRPTLSPQKWDQLRAQHDVLKPCEYKRR